MQSVENELASLADPAYQAFQAKLMPTVDPARILGVRTPDLRRYARAFAHDARVDAFMQELPHRLYEEMNLHGLLIGLRARTASEAFDLLDAFLPHVDNWATCDLIKVPAFKCDLPAVLEKIREWTDSAHEYTVRCGIVQLMSSFLDEAFEPSQLQIVARIRRPEYYVNMARAWYFSFALVKQYDATISLFETATLDAWTHNKSLQKARESRRISAERKAYLQSLKIKEDR